MEELKKAVELKRKKYEEQGFADKDFQKIIDGKTVKMWLPDSVFTQQSMLLLAVKALEAGSNDIDEFSKLKERYARAVAKHTQIDGVMLDIEKAGLADCEAYTMLYWLELLSPLSIWAESRAKKVLTS